MADGNKGADQHGAHKTTDRRGVSAVSSNPDSEKYAAEVTRTLREAQAEVMNVGQALPSVEVAGWRVAGGIIEEFQPIPWFIWRLSNYVFSKPGTTNSVSEGFVLGLRRILFAAASDPVLGCGGKVSSVRGALDILNPGVVAATSVIYAVCRRLSGRGLERIWRPMIEDALLRAHIGYFAGVQSEDFGPGRGMMAGFAGRCGLAILIACGGEDEARDALDLLSIGEEIGKVGNEVYRCHPVQVSAMLLSAVGCGTDSAMGTVAFVNQNSEKVIQGPEQYRWFSAFTMIELARTGRGIEIEDRHWESLNFHDPKMREDFIQMATKVARRGHGWAWMGN